MAKTMRKFARRPLLTVLIAVVVVSFSGWMFSHPWRADASSVISGTVQDPANNTVAEVNLNFWGPGGGGGSRSDSSGAFTVTLNPGHYSGQAVPPDGSAFGPSLVKDFDVVEGGSVTLNFDLTTVQMRGKFTKTDGTGVRGSLNVFNADYSRNVHVESNDSGDYVMGGFPAGTYTAQPMVGWNVTGLIAPDPTEVTLATDSVLTKDFTLSTAVKTISGTVTKAGGTVVANACVNANKMNGQGWANANTDASGNYTMSLSGGSWNVQPNPCNSDADWIFSGTPVMVDFALDATVESKVANFSVASASSTIGGTVTDQTGALVTSGSIDFRTQQGAGMHGTINTNGTYSVRMTGGTYSINFWSQNNGYNLPPTEVTIADNESKVLNLVVQAKTAHIKGTVKDAAGVAAASVMINANEMANTPGKPGAWGNARSATDGSFDLLVTPGTYNLNVGTEPNSSYIWANPSQIQVAVPTATTVITPADYPVLNFVVAKADSRIVGKLTAGGSPLNNAPLCVYARLVGSFNQTCNPLQPNGTFTINVSSVAGTSYEVGCFSPPNMPYSCPQPVAVTVAAGSTVTKDLDLTMNNSSIAGQLYDQSGFPLSNCETFRGSRVFADNPGGNGAHYEGEIGTDCKYRISLVAGVYFLNSYFPPDSGAMNSPPGDPVQVFSSQSVQKNIMVAKADASITVKLLDQNGNGTQGYINVDNNEEINMSREGNNGPAGQGNKGADLGFGKNTPCGAQDINGTMKCCSDAKNKKACQAFAIPDGPQGCKNAWDCVQLCKKDKSICDQADKNNQNAGPQPGQGNFQAGPGGCKTEAECKKYCSEPAHQDECSKFKPPANVQGQNVTKGIFTVKPTRVISSVPVKALAAEKVVAGNGEKGNSNFNQGIHSSGPTDFQGNGKIQVLSGHRYKVCAGLPPESGAMPPKCQTADLTNAKTAAITLQVRQADASLSGTVKLPGGAGAARCFVHAWAEDGSFSGQPCSGVGAFKLNLTADTMWHIGADSMDGTKFYRSEESTLSVVKGTKTYTQNFELIEGDFEIPQPVTTSGDCSSPLVLSMSNGAKISIPAGGLSTSTTGQCSCTATPTIDLISTQSNRPQGAGYTIDCRDETGAQVTQLKSSATVTVPYHLSSNEEGTSIEDSLKPVLFQSDTQSYKAVDSYTLDKTNDLITFSVDHFSAYTVSNSSGVSSNNAALKTVTTVKNRNITSFTVNRKKVTPFPKCTGDVSVVTKSVKGTQLVAAVSSCEGNVKVYDANGKLKKTLKTAAAGLTTVGFQDVTQDGQSDLVTAPTSGMSVWIFNVASKYKALTVKIASRAVRLTATPIDLRGNGVYSLVAGTVKNNTAGDFKVFTYSKGRFHASASSYTSYLGNSNGAIALNIGKAKVTKMSTSSIKTSASKAKVTLTGLNFTQDTSVLVGTVGAKTTFKNTKRLDLVIDGTKLSAGKYKVQLFYPGGQVTTVKTKMTVK